MRVELWTDGSGTVEEAPGGWAYVLVAIDERTGEVLKKVEGHGHVLIGGTNNRMELTALLEGLRSLTRPTVLTVHTDSEYVMKAWTERWLEKWQARKWKKVKNPDLWYALLVAAQAHALSWEWHKGHAGIALNERCDELAGIERRAAIERIAAGEPIPAFEPMPPIPTLF